MAFSNFDKCRPEVAGDVISGAALVYVRVDVRAKFGDSRLNNGRIIRLFGRPDSFYALLGSIYYLNTVCSRLETASDVVFGRFVRSIVPDKPVQKAH